MHYYEEFLDQITIHTGDLPKSVIEKALRAKLVAWDIETSGLNWQESQIGTCQIFIPNSEIHIVKITDIEPTNLLILLSDPKVIKLFHHAMFDLRFMVYKWTARAQSIACTKIASKILKPSENDHSLQTILQHHLQVSLDKKFRHSNWLNKSLAQEQINYAAMDVLFLPQLFEKLKSELNAYGRWSLAQECFNFLPVRVELDILGCSDVFKY